MSYKPQLLPITDGGTGASTSEDARTSTGSIGVLSTTSGIDAKTVATTTLYTVPTGKTAIITGAVARVTSASGFVTAATAGIGVAAGEDDIFPAAVLTSLNGTTKMFSFMNNLLASTMATSTQVIKLGVDVGAVATTLTVSIDLIGYLL